MIEARKKLEEAERLRSVKELARARVICDELLQRYPDYVGALHTLGLILADEHDYTRAMSCLNRAAMLNRKDWRILTALSGVYLRLGAPHMAAQILEQARRYRPEDAGVLVTLGEIYREEREYELAADSFEKARTFDPSLDAARIGLAMCCTHLGRLSEAAEIMTSLVERGSRGIRTLSLLAHLPASMVNIDILPLLDEAVPAGNQNKEEFQSQVAFSRAAALDKAARHAEAWDHLVAANRIYRLQNQDRYRRDSRRQAEFLAWLRGRTIDATAATTGQARHPLSLFILGPSRSGKTTMEYLASLIDGVKRGYENPIVENAVRTTFQSEGFITRDLMVELPAALDDSCRQFYVEELMERAESATVFTNTHPGQIIDAARLAAVIPGVRFIFMKRDIDELTLRIYMKKYRTGNAYAYDIGTIRDYLAWYHGMIDVLAHKLPRICRVIRYEEMIADPTAALSVVAELCGLPSPAGPVIAPGDDRGCAQSYAGFINQALNGSSAGG